MSAVPGWVYLALVIAACWCAVALLVALGWHLLRAAIKRREPRRAPPADT